MIQEGLYKKEVWLDKKMRHKYGNYFIRLIIFASILLFFQINEVSATKSNSNLVNIYFFHSNTCSHCKEEEKLLAELEKQYDYVNVYRYEIHKEDTTPILEKVAEIYSIQIKSVPITIIGNKVYTGYNENTSKLKFIKTIEYFSRYGYQDPLGEYLQIDSLPFYKIEKQTPTLEEFIQSYRNYQIIGSLYTDDLDISLNAILLGILSQINIIYSIAILIVLVLIKRIEGLKNKILLFSFYLGISFLLFSTYMFSNTWFNSSVEILLLLLFIFGLLRYSKTRKQQFILGNGFIILAILANYLGYYFFGKYTSIFKNLLVFQNLKGIEQFMYYANFFISIVITNFLFIYFIWLIVKKLKQKGLFNY